MWSSTNMWLYLRNDTKYVLCYCDTLIGNHRCSIKPSHRQDPEWPLEAILDTENVYNQYLEQCSIDPSQSLLQLIYCFYSCIRTKGLFKVIQLHKLLVSKQAVYYCGTVIGRCMTCDLLTIVTDNFGDIQKVSWAIANYGSSKMRILLLVCMLGYCILPVLQWVLCHHSR